MKNLFQAICKSIALSCVDLVKYYGVYGAVSHIESPAEGGSAKPMKGVVPMKNNFEKKLAEASVAYTYHIGEELGFPLERICPDSGLGLSIEMKGVFSMKKYFNEVMKNFTETCDLYYRIMK